LAKFQSPTAVSWPKIIQPEQISKLICNLWLYALGLWNFAKYLVVATLFHYDLRYWLDFWYECIIISYRSTLKFVPVEWFLVNWQPLNLNCNLSLYTHIANIKSISQSIAKKVVTTVLFRNYGMTDMGSTICPGHFVAGTYKNYAFTYK
jgi:hypothetical protein